MDDVAPADTTPVVDDPMGGCDDDVGGASDPSIDVVDPANGRYDI